MIIGSHNSWTYSKPKKFWMRLFNWCTKCQDFDIRTQYDLFKVRCFDLRISFDKDDNPIITHNKTVYFNLNEVLDELNWLNLKKDVLVRVINDVRTKKKHTAQNMYNFITVCKQLEKDYKDITFFGGTNLYDGTQDYIFSQCVSVGERCASVMPPKWWNGLYPRRYAKKHNTEIKDFGTSRDVLLIDFVNI